MTRWRAAAIAALMGGSAWAGDLAFVTAQNADTLAIVDVDSGDVVETPVPGAPAPVACDARRDRAYVVSAKTGRITVVDHTGHVIATHDAGEGTFGIAVDPASGDVLVGDWYGHRLRRMTADFAPVWQPETGRAPTGIAITGDMVITADRDDDRVSVFGLSDGVLRGHVAVGAHPFGLTAHDGLVYSANVEDASVSVIEPVRLREVRRIPVGQRPYGIAFAAGRGFVTNQADGTVTVFDVAGGEVIDTLDTGDYPEGIAAVSGDRIAVVHWFDNTLTILDARTLKVLYEIDTPDGPRAFGLFTCPAQP